MAEDGLFAELFGSDEEDEPLPVERKVEPEEARRDEEPRPDAQVRASRRKATGQPLHLEVPVPTAPTGTSEAMMLRLSNIVAVKHRPFDPDSHAVEGEVVFDEKGNERFKPLDLNVIRWRIGTNELGEETVESNARLVRFSDGSVQLEIGDEVLKATEADISKDNDHLFVDHGAGVLECRGQMNKKLTCRPSSLNSKSHRLLTAHVDNKHVKVTRTKRTVTLFDPELELERRRKEIDKEEKEKRALARGQARELTRHTGGHLSPVRRSPTPPYYGGRAQKLSASFLEQDEPDDRRGPSRKGGGGPGASGKKGKQKRSRAHSDSEESGSDDSYSEEPQKKKKSKATGRVIEEDSDDSDDER